MSEAGTPSPLRRVRSRVVQWARYRSERYVWHECHLATVQPSDRRFVDDLTLRLATDEDLPAVARIGVPDLHRTEEFRSKGGELWVGETPEGLAIAFWVFHTGMPLYPWLSLPEDTVAIEHTTVSAEIRGLGYAPAALTEKLADLGKAGYAVAVTKIVDTNRPSLRSARKLGFVPTALMYRRRIAGRERTIVEAWTDFARHLSVEVGAPGTAARETNA